MEVVSSNYNYASGGKRLLAFFIDRLLLHAVFSVIFFRWWGMPFGWDWDNLNFGIIHLGIKFWEYNVFVEALIVLYYSYMESSKYQATIGKLALNSIRGITNQQINSVIVNNNHNYKFVYYLLQNNTTQIRNLASQTAIPIINKTSFSNLEFFAPKSLIEEDKIVSIIEQQDSLIESEQTNLAKLQNIKQGLMSDLLTGKIRVKI